MNQPKTLCLAAIILILLLLLSGLQPYDRATWLMEVVPCPCCFTYLICNLFQISLTNLLYSLIFACNVLIAGGHIPMHVYL
jgi:putative membrane protein